MALLPHHRPREPLVVNLALYDAPRRVLAGRGNAAETLQAAEYALWCDGGNYSAGDRRGRASIRIVQVAAFVAGGASVSRGTVLMPSGFDLRLRANVILVDSPLAGRDSNQVVGAA